MAGVAAHAPMPKWLELWVFGRHWWVDTRLRSTRQCNEHGLRALFVWRATLKVPLPFRWVSGAKGKVKIGRPGYLRRSLMASQLIGTIGALCADDGASPDPTSRR